MTYSAAERGRLLRLLADILDYPAAGLAGKLEQCEDLAASMVPAAVPPIRAFRSIAEGTPLGRLEEVYTGFFDLNPVCYPYVGYHLFGETYKRSAFLLALQERYRARGFTHDERELADRLSVVLRFVAHAGDGAECEDLVREGVVPALERMIGQEGSSTEPAAGSEPGTPELEGHSEGEVLTGGFLLEMTEGAAASGRAREAYREALRAVRTVLEALWGPCATGQAARATQGRNDG